MKALRYLNKYLLKYKRYFLGGVFFIISANLFAVFPAIFFGRAINAAIRSIAQYRRGGRPDTAALHSELLLYVALILGTALIRAMLTFFQRQTLIVMSRKIEYDLRNEVYEHYQRLSPNFYKNNKIGDLMSRLTEDIAQVRMYLGPGIMYPINMFFLTLIVMVQMYRTDPILATCTLVPLPLLSYSIFKISQAIHAKSMAKQQLIARVTAFVQEKISGIRVIKSFGIEAYMLSHYKRLAEKNKAVNLELARFEAWFYPMVLLLIGISYTAILYIGGMRAIEGAISPGQIATFILYLNMIIWPVTALGWTTSIIQRAESSQKRINAFLSERPEIKNEHPKHSHIRGEISFKNVYFTYGNTGIQALKGISFRVNPGKTLAIFGETGSGKSTLVELIARFYKVDRGVILIDGKPVETINLYDLRNAIGYVPQEAFLFSDNLTNNIGFSTDDPDPDAVREASRLAAFHDNAMGFTQGYQTQVGERGVMLSGGQKQRVSIARAILKDPAIYLFDDSLSAVDTQTEGKILSGLRKAAAGKTTLIVSHRVSAAKRADEIIVLREGCIIQRGTHLELIRQDGYYRNAYKRQALEERLS